MPYACGISIVADLAALHAVGVHPNYVQVDGTVPADPNEKVPEFSRRARRVPGWAATRRG